MAPPRGHHTDATSINALVIEAQVIEALRTGFDPEIA